MLFNEIVIIVGLFIDFAGAFIVLYDEYLVGKLKRINPDLTERELYRIGGGWSRQRNRKCGLIALMVGFIVQVIGHVLPT